MIVINEDVIALQHTIGGKIQGLTNELNSLQDTINNLESQYGQLGMISRVENLLERTMSKRLGWNIKFISDIDKNYVKRVSIATKVPIIMISRKFTTDVVNALKAGDCSSVLLKLKNELKNIANKVVHQGEEPFKEDFTYNLNYIVIEASTAGGSFHAALPVDALSLVDTDGDSYRAKETKKDIFILEPTKECLQRALIKALDNKNLTEEQKQKYSYIIRNGSYKIIKEHIQESISKIYKILGNKIMISNIYNK